MSELVMSVDEESATQTTTENTNQLVEGVEDTNLIDSNAEPSTDTENNLQTNTDRIENVKSTAPSSNDVKLTHLPLSRIKQIMKLDGDITVVPLECVFLVTKAVELFVQSLAREACTFTQQNDKKTLQKRDIESAISQVESLIFLEETL